MVSCSFYYRPLEWSQTLWKGPHAVEIVSESKQYWDRPKDEQLVVFIVLSRDVFRPCSPIWR